MSRCVHSFSADEVQKTPVCAGVSLLAKPQDEVEKLTREQEDAQKEVVLLCFCPTCDTCVPFWVGWRVYVCWRERADWRFEFVILLEVGPGMIMMSS